jgi:hypothetical protein
MGLIGVQFNISVNYNHLITECPRMERKKLNKTVCAVAICPSPKNSSTVYHRFPKNQELIKKWIVACKRQDKINPKTASICSEHFLPSDYDRDLQNELLGLPIKKLLKKDAIPTVNLLPPKSLENSTIESNKNERRKRQEQREEKRQQKELIDSLLLNDSNSHLEEEGFEMEEPLGRKVDISTQKNFDGIDIGIQVNVPKGLWLYLCDI